MIDYALKFIPVKARGDAFLCIFVVLAFAVGFATNMLYRTRYVTQIVHTHPSVTQVLGKPTQSIDGAQINQGLTGLTCDIYQTKKVVYCH